LFGGANSEVVPRVYVYAGEAAGVFSVRVSGDMPAALAYIDRTWHSFLPNLFNSRSFLDDKFAKLYAANQRQGEIFGIFVAIAIFIAGLGLFGLAAFTAGRRTREIGIRKVFGARTRDVTFLLLWQFSIPVLIANVIAWPIAWYYLHGWLQGFAFRISLSPLYFISTGLAALLIAWATIFVHAHRVARANPINALRTE
jgi:putative ABC transport system permease protein